MATEAGSERCGAGSRPQGLQTRHRMRRGSPWSPRREHSPAARPRPPARGEGIYLCFFKPLNSWESITAAAGNHSHHGGSLHGSASLVERTAVMWPAPLPHLHTAPLPQPRRRAWDGHHPAYTQFEWSGTPALRGDPRGWQPWSLRPRGRGQAGRAALGPNPSVLELGLQLGNPAGPVTGAIRAHRPLKLPGSLPRLSGFPAPHSPLHGHQSLGLLSLSRHSG